MHVLLVGFGNMGKKYLLKLEELGESPILCDRDPKKATDKYPFYCHIGDVKEEIKAVIIAVEPSEHVSLSRIFLKRGIPVLLEKPPALNYEEFKEIYSYPNLYVSEVETFSSCLQYFPKDVKSLNIERFGKGKGYISPLWDLAWHDLYLLQLFFKSIELKKMDVNHVWELKGEADGVPFILKVAWEHPEPSRRWIINEGDLVLDFAKEEVWKDDKLLSGEKRDKLRIMVERFLAGRFDQKSKERAMKNLLLLEEAERFFRI
ncbi:MAG: Gfo/Idh/MocA family oxidoreductase [Hydrogenobacter sp.]|uniref:Gfo/Idh/MocA family oxidoreductase n=1 Tax=Hydrogenobacter thermophilus TaxID=940 RepID=UPI0030FC6256